MMELKTTVNSHVFGEVTAGRTGGGAASCHFRTFYPLFEKYCKEAPENRNLKEGLLKRRWSDVSMSRYGHRGLVLP